MLNITEWDTGTADLAKLEWEGEDLFPSNWKAVGFEEIWMQSEEVDDNAAWFWL